MMPSLVLAILSLAKSKKINAAIRGRTVIDGNGLGRVAWQLPEQSSTILVLNKAGRIQWAKDGSLTTGRGRSCHCAGAETDQ